MPPLDDQPVLNHCRHSAHQPLSPHSPACLTLHHPKEGAPVPPDSQVVCPPHLISMGTEVKCQQLSTPRDLCLFHPHFSSHSQLNLFAGEQSWKAKTSGELRSLCGSTPWRGSPLHSPTHTSLMGLFSSPCRQTRHRSAMRFSRGQAGDVPCG